MTTGEPTREQRSTGGLLAGVLSAWHDPAARIRNVDVVAVLLAASLPWSTSAVAILAVIWLIALIPTLDLRAFVRTLGQPVCWLPILLFLLAAAGMLWSVAPWPARVHAAGQCAKLLVLPALLYHFARSPRGMWVFVAFLASCTLLMLASWLVLWEPGLSPKPLDTGEGVYRPGYGIVVKNYINQSQEFALCAVALAYPIFLYFRDRKIWHAVVLSGIALAFLANMAFTSVSRTAMVTMPVMLAVFALLHLRLRTSVIIFGALAILAALAWVTSPKLQNTTDSFLRDYRLYVEKDVPTSVGLRLEYWRKSLGFVAEAPVIGHGTGSIGALFERAAVGSSEFAQGQVVRNPHNQTLTVAIQWGSIRIWSIFTKGGCMCWVSALPAAWCWASAHAGWPSWARRSAGMHGQDGLSAALLRGCRNLVRSTG
jgi:O-antigen ligase